MKWREIWARLTPRKIIIYADFIDPFCYIGFHNASRAADEKKIPLEWRGFELNPDTPAEGAVLESAANSDLRPGMWASVKDFAKKSGLILSEPRHVPNTQLAQLWVHSIQNSDVKKSLIERIYQAYLSDKKDIGKLEALLPIAESLSLPTEPLKRLNEKRSGDSLEIFRRQAVAFRFAGMPGFVFKGKTYFGAISKDAWKNILEETL